MDDETAMTAWEELGGRAVASAEPSTLPSISSRMADQFDLVPVTREEFAAELTPCLALVSGTGMSREDRRAWLSAAWRALDGIPIKLLKRGCDQAMKVADHPAKIVPAIMAEIGETWKWRKEYRSPPPVASVARALPAPGGERATPEEVDEILKRFAVGRYAKPENRAPRESWRGAEIKGGSDRPARTPTRDDYIRLGVDPAVLDQLDAEKAQREAQGDGA